MTHHLITTVPLAGLALAAASIVLAEPAAMPLTYEQFEASVAHVDLDTCPTQLRQPGTFCRATLNHGEIHVFAFSEENDSPMTGFTSYPTDTLGALLK